jgi:hypothetical protein
MEEDITNADINETLKSTKGEHTKQIEESLLQADIMKAIEASRKEIKFIRPATSKTKK